MGSKPCEIKKGAEIKHFVAQQMQVFLGKAKGVCKLQNSYPYKFRRKNGLRFQYF